MTIQDGTLTFVHKMQVLHHVRYFKLNAYVQQHSSNIQTNMHIYEWMPYIIIIIIII